MVVVVVALLWRLELEGVIGVWLVGVTELWLEGVIGVLLVAEIVGLLEEVIGLRVWVWLLVWVGVRDLLRCVPHSRRH